MKRKIFHIGLFDGMGLENDTVRSLKLMILGVAFGTISFNINGGISMTGYLKALGASDFTFGLLYAIGPLAAPMQLLVSYMLERTKKRRAIFLVGGIIQRMSWLPFGLVPFFVPMEQPVLRIWIASLFLMISAVLISSVNVPFFSLAADIVPMNIRGSYFALRSRIATMFAVVGGIATAWFLDTFTGFSSYAFVFTLSAVMGTLDIVCFFWVKFPPMAESSGSSESPGHSEKFTHMMAGVFKNKKYMKFIVFMMLWQFSVNMAGPFYLVYLKNVVNLSNTLITALVQILPSVCSIIFVRRWGRAIDSHGNKTIMQVANGILCVVSFIWVFVSDNAFALVFIVIAQFAGGCIAAGFDIGVNNIMLGQAPKENRSMYIAVYFM